MKPYYADGLGPDACPSCGRPDAVLPDGTVPPHDVLGLSSLCDAPYYADDAVTLHHGDALEVLRSLPDASVDAVVTDPPYGLEFMGREWDSFRPSAARIRSQSERDRQPGAAHNGSTFLASRGVPDAYVAGVPFQQWCQVWAAECLRILKPGGHLLAFGGTRTVHRLTCAIEDAGFEIRDGIDWLYASGFPKSLDVSKAIDKAAGAQREVIRPRTYALANDGGYSGGLNTTKPRSESAEITAPATDDAARWSGWGTALKPAREPIVMARKPLAGTVAATVLAYGTGALNIDDCRVGTTRDVPASLSRNKNPSGDYGPRKAGTVRDLDANIGRWPANVILSHAPDCGEECLPGCPVAELDAQSGSVKGATSNGKCRGSGYAEGFGVMAQAPSYADEGGASRFFPVFRYEAKAPTAERPRTPDGTAHPTVKPLDLMRWLVRLVTPPGGTVLEPFAGSGTTAEACVLEGFRCIAIEREPAYLPLIVARLSKPLQPSLDLFGGVA